MRGECFAVPVKNSQRGFAIVDPMDWPRVRDFRWFAHPQGYAQAYCRDTYRQNGGKRRAGGSAGHVLMHRLLAGAPKGLVVDHVNGDRLDNRRENLRVVTQAENCRNPNDRRRGRPRKVKP